MEREHIQVTPYIMYIIIYTFYTDVFLYIDVYYEYSCCLA